MILDEKPHPIPGDWYWSKIGIVAKVGQGGTPNTENPEYWNGTIPWLRSGEIRNNLILDSEKKITESGLEGSSATFCPKDTVLLAMTGQGLTRGRCAILGIGASMNQSVTYLIPNKEDLETKFLFYYLRSMYWDIRKIEKGSNQPGLNTTIIKKFSIPIPKYLKIQKNIVKKIELIVGNIQKLAQLRTSQLSSIENLMQSSLDQIFSSGKKNGWNFQSIIDVCDVNPSKSELKDVPGDRLVSFVPMEVVDEITGTIEEKRTASLSKVKKGYTYFKENDIIFAKITPSMENGKVAIAKDLKNKIGFGSTEFHVIRTKEEVIPGWIYHFLRQKKYRFKAKKNMTGTAGQQRVPRDFIENTEIPIPDTPIQIELVNFLDKLQMNLQKLYHENYSQKENIPILYYSVLKSAFRGMLKW